MFWTSVRNDDDTLVLIPRLRKRAKNIDGNEFKSANRWEERQVASISYRGFSLGTLQQVVYYCADVAGHVSPVIFLSHWVIHPSLSGVSSWSWMMGQIQVRGLECFQHDSLNCTIRGGLSHKKSINIDIEDCFRANHRGDIVLTGQILRLSEYEYRQRRLLVPLFVLFLNVGLYPWHINALFCLAIATNFTHSILWSFICFTRVSWRSITATKMSSLVSI